MKTNIVRSSGASDLSAKKLTHENTSPMSQSDWPPQPPAGVKPNFKEPHAARQGCFILPSERQKKKRSLSGKMTAIANYFKKIICLL